MRSKRMTWVLTLTATAAVLGSGGHSGQAVVIGVPSMRRPGYSGGSWFPSQRSDGAPEEQDPR